MLCAYCNNKRLKNEDIKFRKEKGLYIYKPSKKLKNIRAKDREVYDIVWRTKPHYCEECYVHIREASPHNFSHILSKGAEPRARHLIRNFNLLCFNCHNKWEFGKRSEMRIYKKNVEIIQSIKNELHKTS